jgi:hypothetical protein
MMKFFNKQKKEPENIEEILVGFKNLKEKFDEVSKELEDMKQKSNFFMQKVGMIRFNPFKEVGGDQSFSLAILDGNDSGVVITSYYSRKENRIYGKPIKNGNSDYPLSEEEVLAIEKAKNSNYSVLTEDKPKNSGKKIKKDNGKQ